MLALAQQLTVPVIGLLSSLMSNDRPRIMAGFQQGLGAAGFVEGRNAAIDYRLAEGDYEQLPALAVDLVRRQVALIAAISGTPASSRIYHCLYPPGQHDDAIGGARTVLYDGSYRYLVGRVRGAPIIGMRTARGTPALIKERDCLLEHVA